MNHTMQSINRWAERYRLWLKARHSNDPLSGANDPEPMIDDYIRHPTAAHRCIVDGLKLKMSGQVR